MRTIGGTENQWGVSLWSGPEGSVPFNATWQAPAQDTDLAATLMVDPSGSAGVSVGPLALGGLRFVVEALNPAADPDSVWGVALWGSGHWNSTRGDWQDITARVRGITWANGADDVDQPPSVGTADITLDNLDGDVSPWATSGDFASGGDKPWLRAGTLVRFGVTATSTSLADPSVPVTLAAYNAFFTGRVEQVTESSAEGADAWATLHLAETSADLATKPGAIQLRQGETVSASLLGILEGMGWELQSDMRVPDDDGQVRGLVIGGADDDATATALLERVAAGKHWSVLADGRGRIMAVLRGAASTYAGMTFSNNPGVNDLPIATDAVSTYSGTERILNVGRASNKNGGQVQAADFGSQSQYGVQSQAYGFPREDLVLIDDASVRALLTSVVSNYATTIWVSARSIWIRIWTRRLCRGL
jgi:hypothetical protein